MLKRTHSIARKGATGRMRATMGARRCRLRHGQRQGGRRHGGQLRKEEPEGRILRHHEGHHPQLLLQGSEYAGKSTKQIKKLLEKTIGTKAVKNLRTAAGRSP